MGGDGRGEGGEGLIKVGVPRSSQVPSPVLVASAAKGLSLGGACQRLLLSHNVASSMPFHSRHPAKLQGHMAQLIILARSRTTPNILCGQIRVALFPIVKISKPLQNDAKRTKSCSRPGLFFRVPILSPLITFCKVARPCSSNPCRRR